jgi:lipoprotein signal peptidase
MTDCAPSFPGPEEPLRAATRSVAGSTAGSPRSTQIGHVLRSRQLDVAAAGGRATAPTALSGGHDPAIGPGPLRESALRRGIRARWTRLLCLAIVLVDQASKAVQLGGTFVVNTGGPGILPASLGSMLWKSQTFGAVCDTADTVLLLVGLRLAHRLTHTSQRVAATGVFAGLLSNLLDRLGVSSLFHVGLPRGSIDWIPVPGWPAARSNMADIVIAVGLLAFTYHPLRHAIRALRSLLHRSRRARFAAAGIGLVAVAMWTTFWQANRNTAELRTTTRSETATWCTMIASPSDGMDWLSHRPNAGPIPYDARADAPDSSRGIGETAGVGCRALR